MFQVNSSVSTPYKPEKLSITFRDNFYWEKENIKKSIKT